MPARLALLTLVISLAAGPAIAADEDRAANFVKSYTTAWAAHDAAALGRLWDPDGVLIDPLYDREIKGREIVVLTRGQLARNPDLQWKLERWSSRGDDVVMEFTNTFTVAGRSFTWRGVDWMRLRNGRIVEERAYLDTGPLRALREGKPAEPLVRLPSPEANGAHRP